MGWILRATDSGLGMVADEDGVKRAIELFADPEHGIEVMALRSGAWRTHRGSDVAEIVQSIKELPSGAGVYFRINPVPPTMEKSANNGDIIKRRWIYIDIDPNKADQDSSATDEEKERTKRVAGSVKLYLQAHGWPNPVFIDSGNGHALLWRCDLPNDKIVQATYRKLLNLLSEKFSSNDGKIDKAVHNANRLVKIPGTWARKGTHTDERPHRPSRIIYVPDDLREVSYSLLNDAAGEEKQAKPDPQQNGKHIGGGYIKAAVDAEYLRVVMANPGERNNALNRAAFSLGQLVAGGNLTRSDVEDKLFDAACKCGLNDDPDCGEKGIRATIRSGIEAGSKEPRAVPELPVDPRLKWGSPDSPPVADGDRLTVRMSDVEPKEVDWLWLNRIPKRFITVFAGRTSVGKSFVSYDLISRLSKGGEIPLSNGECFPAGGTLIISEDSAEYVIAPRLIEAGADMKRIHAMNWAAMNSYHIGNTEMLSRACNEVEGGVRCVMIDPPTNFIEGINEHKNSEVRQLVMRVVQWAFDHDCAVLFILHVNKQAGKGIEALNRVMGSVAWMTTARIGHSFCTDPEDRTRCLWVPLKNNLGAIEKAIAYRIEKQPSGMALINWLEEVDTTADDAMGGDPPRKRRDIVAAEWLIDRFREKLEWESEDLFDRADQEGISRNAVFEAKKILKLPRARRVVRENGDIEWHWWVPEDWDGLKESNRPSD